MFDIIICTYNGEKVIKRAIESILKQNSYKKLINNFFIVDNNSKDNSKQIIKEFEKTTENLKYLFQPKQGLSNARLKGVKNAKSKWIVFVDDDNVLEQNWLINAKKYIEENVNIGAFNGAVIPLIEEALTEEEVTNLEIAYKGLACTHLKKENINLDEKRHPCRLPFGAGLVIRTKELKELAEDGWLKSEGRKGKKIISGEDTEMVEYLLEKGYQSGYQPLCLINHVMGKERLDQKYLIKLFKSFRNYSKTKNFKCFLKVSIKEIIIKLLLISSKKDYKELLKLRLGIYRFKS